MSIESEAREFCKQPENRDLARDCSVSVGLTELINIMASFANSVTADKDKQIAELEAEVQRLRSLWGHSMVTDDRNSEG